jgi:hypothetical protein
MYKTNTALVWCDTVLCLYGPSVSPVYQMIKPLGGCPHFWCDTHTASRPNNTAPHATIAASYQHFSAALSFFWFVTLPLSPRVCVVGSLYTTYTCIPSFLFCFASSFHFPISSYWKRKTCLRKKLRTLLYHTFTVHSRVGLRNWPAFT